MAGYDCILLDTLDDMGPPAPCTPNWGFEEIPPYYCHNPIAGASITSLAML